MSAIYHSRTTTKRELEEKIKNVGDYVKMDLLSSALKMSIDIETKKYVLAKLTEIYEARRMFSEAARMIRNAAELTSTYDEKMNSFMKSFTLFVRGGTFDEADVSFTKALGCATELQKGRLKIARKEAYKAQANEFVIKGRRSHAVVAYEKILALELTPSEKTEIQTTLLTLYEKLGKVKDFYALKASM